ncbi:MAG: SDR family oxidoreductase [Tidjanibacter sp.]|nr:SDR family oxidoreductase [Tidjanibacter sp.]MBQ5613499.1 SDR family oxidoreductase [Tidjanibacter sp.]MBQ6604181.1 SDR family oxidoreductase [Tidjanibacter sp.]
MKRLEGNVTIITGGGKGIGYGLAEAFAREGSNLVITGRTLSRLESAKERLEAAYGVEVLPIVADGADEEAIKNVVAKTIERFGKITTLINNAQVSKSGLPLVEHTREDIDLAINSGIYAVFFYMRECYPYLKESHGSVINFASGAGLFGRPGQSSYAAAKEGIRGLSRVAATEWGPDGIRVNVVCPLAMTESLEAWSKEYPELFQKTIQGIPLGRYADPREDIGRVCVFLASDDAGFVTGETITLQGGSGLRP